jgi:hypothetical protein
MTPDIESRAITTMAVAQLRPFANNARTHSAKQIRQIADSIVKFGFTNPVLIGDDDEIIAGHGRVEAAKLLGLQSVPTLRLSHLDAAQRRAYMLADNKLALGAGWDRDALAAELRALADMECDVGATGFAVDEIELVLRKPQRREASGAAASTTRRHRARAKNHPDPLHSPEHTGVNAPKASRAREQACVTGIADTWLIGRHRLLCGDCDDLTIIDRMLHEERIVFIAFDPTHCDQIARRFRELTGQDATLAQTGQDFTEVTEQRTQSRN